MGTEVFAPLKSLQPIPDAITLVDKNSYHYLQTEAYRFVSGRMNTCDTTYNLQTFCDYFENVSFVLDEALNVEGKELVCSAQRITFEILIIAVGLRDFIPEAMKPFAYAIKDIRKAYAFKREFLSILFERMTTRANRKHIVIGGAGQSGVELAVDLMSIANECGNNTGSSNDIEVTLIEGGINIHTGKFIDEVTSNEIRIADDKIAYDLFLFCGGVEPIAFAKNLPFKKDAKSYLLVDKHLRLDEDIYAIGDAARITDENTKPLPPTAQLAEQCAEYVAKVINEGYNQPFSGKIYGMFTALGHRYGVGELFGTLHAKGALAYYMKELITKLYALGIKTKINAAYHKRKKY